MPGWIDIVLRSIIFLIALFFITKWLGKKQLSQMSIFEFISSIVLGGIVAIHSSSTNSPIMYGLIAMLVWLLIPYTVIFFSLKKRNIRTFFQGKSTVFIQEGKIMEENLNKEKYSTDDLLENLRHKDIFKVADVEFAVLEPSGQLNVLLKRENKPLTAKDIGITLAPESEPETVIMDGEMLLEPLANLSLNPHWLETELEKTDVTIENVFLGQVDSYGQLTIDLYDDKIVVPPPSEKPLLLATLKKSQADLEIFALATENEQSKKMYEQNSEKVTKVIELLAPYLQK